MSDERWIIVTNWERYQHRDTGRSKVPPWVKNETKLLSSPDYIDLSPHCRAVLHGLWLEYARSLRRLPNNTATLTRRLGMKVFRSHLEALNHAGFIAFSDSKPASSVPPVDREGDREGEKASEEVRGARNPDDDFAHEHGQSPTSELVEHLDTINIGGPLRQAALANPLHALHTAQKTLAANPRNPAGYFRRIFQGDTATTTTNHGENVQPRNPAAAIRTMITNGALTNLVDLEAELTAAHINGTTGDQLRALLNGDNERRFAAIADTQPDEKT